MGLKAHDHFILRSFIGEKAETVQVHFIVEGEDVHA